MKNKELKTPSKLDNLICDSWVNVAKSYLEAPSMYTPVKKLNKKWKWYKIFTKKYIYQLQYNKNFKKNFIIDVDIKKAIKRLK